MLIIRKSLFGIRWGYSTLYVKCTHACVKCTHFKEFLTFVGIFVKKHENQQYPRARTWSTSSRIILSSSTGLYMIENIDFENTTEKRRSVRVDQHPQNKTPHTPSHHRASDFMRAIYLVFKPKKGSFFSLRFQCIGD